MLCSKRNMTIIPEYMLKEKKKKRFGFDKEFNFECIMLCSKRNMTIIPEYMFAVQLGNLFISHQALDGISNHASG